MKMKKDELDRLKIYLRKVEGNELGLDILTHEENEDMRFLLLKWMYEQEGG